MIRKHFRNALDWYQVLVMMADQEVNTWVWNMTFTVTTSPDNTNAADHSSGIEISASTPETLGRTSMPFCQSDMPNTLPPPFPLPQDFLQMEENIPSTDALSIYLQWRCPICFSGMPNLQTSMCILNAEV